MPTISEIETFSLNGNEVRQFPCERVHISEITVGDTVYIDGVLRTVSRANFCPDGFMGPTLFGDSFHLGTKKITRVKLRK